ncbi:MAG: hypothetical protein QXX08_02550 [Candidatus Bathyarchaeia archaeon]
MGEKVRSAWELWIFSLIGQIILFVAILTITWFIKQHPLQNVDSFINAVLASSSVLFGFLTLSITRHLEELRKQEQDISNVAAEILSLLEKVRKDEKLAGRTIQWSTKYYNWGFEGFGVSDTAESAIMQAYDYLLKNFRFIVHSCRLLVFAWGIPGLALLLSSIILTVFSKIMILNPDLVGTIGLGSIMFGITVTILGWWVSNKRLEKNSESLFNMRHYILGALFSEKSHAGYLRDGWLKV